MKSQTETQDLVVFVDLGWQKDGYHWDTEGSCNQNEKKDSFKQQYRWLDQGPKVQTQGLRVNIVGRSQQPHISPFSNQTNILYDIKSNDIIYNWNWESSHGQRSN